MAAHTRIWITLLTLLFMSLPVTAEILRATIVTDVVEGDKKSKDNEIMTVDGADKARLEILGEESEPSDKTPYLLTVDGGKTWLIGNKAEAFCAQMDTDEFFQYLGQLAVKYGGLVNLDLAEPKINKVLEEKGPDMHGYPTRHIRLETTAAGKASAVLKKYDYQVHITDDIWYTPTMEIHPVRKRWLEALSQTGYKELDSLADQWAKNLSGAILKQESEIKITNVIKKKEDIIRETTRIVTLEKLKPTDLPEHTFQMPECKKISKKEMRKTAMDLFERGKIL